MSLQEEREVRENNSTDVGVLSSCHPPVMSNAGLSVIIRFRKKEKRCEYQYIPSAPSELGMSRLVRLFVLLFATTSLIQGKILDK